MPWVKKMHKCSRPSAIGKGVGSEWRCRKCKTVWRFVRMDGDYSLWRRIDHD